MKHFHAYFSRKAVLLLFTLTIAGIARGQVVRPALAPAPEISPTILNADGVVTIALPLTTTTSGARLRVGVYEHGRPALLNDTLPNFVAREGKLQATLRLSAEAGLYDVRVISNDRARRFLSEPAIIVVPGIDREPGWWLFNGAPFSTSSDLPAVDGSGSIPPRSSTPAAALFVRGLGRDFDRKAKPQTGSILLPGGQIATWKRFPLPALSVIAAPGYDFAALRASLREELGAAQARGESGYVGFELPADFASPSASTAAVKSLRSLLDELAPKVALILTVDSTPSAPDAIDAVAALCDAVVVQGRTPADLWSIKVARRVAEEQTDYDLPIFVRASTKLKTDSDETFLLQAFMSGATGVLDGGGATSGWGRVVQRNLPLFVGSVTLEDIGLLPDSEEKNTLQMYERLKSAGRVPLLARLNAKRGATESLVTTLDERVSQRTVNDLLASARGGARLYIEGAPRFDEDGKPLDSRIETLLGGRATPIQTHNATLTLDDPWIFGVARGQGLAVRQSATIKLREKTDNEKKVKKGEIAPELSVAARLEDGSPGVIVNPVGDGEVVWLPHRFLEEEAAPLYYAAIAGRMQSALVQLSDVAAKNGSTSDAKNVRAALRASSNGTLLLALFNTGDQAVTVAATVRADAGLAFDLATEKALPLSVRGLQVQTPVSLAAHGWALVAFAKTRENLDKERNAPRLKARWR